jgi:hypothetical protein
MRSRTTRPAICSALGLAMVALLGSGRAFAEDKAAPAEGAPSAGGDASATTPPPATASVSAPISASEATLHQGAIDIDGDVVMSLSKGAAFKPVQIVPNLYYGVSPELTAGFAQNPFAEIFQTTGKGLCLNGTPTCAHLYNNFSLDALFSFMRSSTVDLAAHGGVDFASLDPFFLSLRLGVKAKMATGPLAIVFDPALNIGLTKRDAGNKEVLTIPARVGFMVMSQLNVGLSIALVGPTDGFGDKYTIPLGAGATYSISSTVDVRAQFAFDNLAGKGGSADFRTLSVGAAYHM